MQNTIENRVGGLIREINELKKELVLKKTKKINVGPKKIITWRRLSNKISAKWDNVSAVEEITHQREKIW